MARLHRAQNRVVASNSLKLSATTDSVVAPFGFLKPRALDGDGRDHYGKGPMRLVKVSIWLATLFFIAMLFIPLIREVIHRAISTGQLP